MTDEELNEDRQRKPLVDTRTIVIGGGILAIILFLFFRGGGGGKLDTKPLEFRLRRDGLWLGHYQKFKTYGEAIDRIKAGGKTSIVLHVAGDVRQGEVDTAIAAFTTAGITISMRSSGGIASIYQRGLGGSVA